MLLLEEGIKDKEDVAHWRSKGMVFFNFFFFLLHLGQGSQGNRVLFRRSATGLACKLSSGSSTRGGRRKHARRFKQVFLICDDLGEVFLLLMKGIVVSWNLERRLKKVDERETWERKAIEKKNREKKRIRLVGEHKVYQIIIFDKLHVHGCTKKILHILWIGYLDYFFLFSDWKWVIWKPLHFNNCR